MSPMVSVVIKSYNHAAYIHQSIQSILDQSFQDFEIVITDDGSTDKTPDIIRKFTDPRIHLEILPNNNGISIAMNKTIERARGKYIAILNSDDYALSGRLEQQVKFLESNSDISVLFGLPMPVDDNGRETESFDDFTRPLSFPDFSCSTWLRNFFFHGNCLCAPTAMIRSTVYKQVGEYDPRLTALQDFEMWIRMLKARNNFYVLPIELTAFRIRDKNLNMSAPRFDSRLRSTFELSQVLKQYCTVNLGLLTSTFSKDIARIGLSSDDPYEVWIPELALTINSPAHNLFALQLMFDTAKDINDIHRLRDYTGRINIFNIFKQSSKIFRAKKIIKSIRTLLKKIGAS
ncbi:MAG: glycosyltransferase [Nitrosomonadales bacterium]|nr:MAG: glycosyltransferase [Nitrosomonadales bacterium]